MSLNETNSSTQSLQDKLQQVQRALVSSEQERHLLHEKHEQFKLQQLEAKRMIESLNEKIQMLKHNIADAEVSIYLVLFYIGILFGFCT